MFKKTLITAMVFVFGAGVLFAHPNQKMEEKKKDFQEMNILVENYKKEKNKKKKAAIEEQIKQKVAVNYDKHVEFMEKMVADSEKRLSQAKIKLAAAKEPQAKEKHITEITVKIISGEKPTLFAPPDKDCPFAKHHKKHHHHKGMDKGCGCQKDFKGHMHGMDFDGPQGDMLPPFPPDNQQPAQLAQEQPAEK